MSTIERKTTAFGLLLVALTLALIAALYAKTAADEKAMYMDRVQLLRDMIATTDHGFVVLSPEQKIVEWGPGAEKIFGWDAYEVIGSDPDFMMPPEYRERHHKLLAKKDYEFSRRLSEVDCWAYRKTGESIPVHVVVSSLHGDSGFYRVALFTRTDPQRVPVSQPAKEPETQRTLPRPGPTNYQALGGLTFKRS